MSLCSRITRLLCASTALLGLSSITMADTLASWNFNSTTVSASASTTVGPISADAGDVAASAAASGLHASGSTVWSTPVGNGSPKGLSANNWGANDYYQFTVDASAYQAITFGWSQTRSSTGPATWKVQYAVGSGSFVDIGGTYTVGTTSWSSGSTASGSIFAPVAIPADANNQAQVKIRLVSTVAGAAAGTCRIDDVIIAGTPGSNNPNAGACCFADGSCTSVITSECTTAGGTFQGVGIACGSCPQPSGSCCVPGLGCQLVSSSAECTTFGGNTFVANGTCTPGPCIPVTPVAVQVGDFALATNKSAATDTLFQIRGVGAATNATVGSWQQFPFIEFAKFDNANGVNHSNQGNLLGLNFGNSGGGGPLYSYATDGTNNAQLLLDQAGFNAVLGSATSSRVGGISVNPSNTRIAVTGYDIPAVTVLSYNAGATPGSGAGASITGGNTLTTLSYITSPKGTWGTAWLDNDTVMVAVRTGGQSFSLYTIPVSGVDSGTTFGSATPRVTVTDPGPDASPQSAIAYNPQLSNYVYVLSSAFQGSTTNTLYIVDPSTWAVVKQLNLSTSMNTGRDLAIGNDRNLYITSRIDASQPAIYKLVLNPNNDTTISAAEIAALTDNSTTAFYSNSAIGTTGFTGMDIAIGAQAAVDQACCLAGVCTVVAPATCTANGGTVQAGVTTCTPNNCPQPNIVCCLPGNNCSSITESLCTSSGGTVQTGATSCTPSPCAPAMTLCCRGTTCAMISGSCTAPSGVGTSSPTGATCNSNGNGTTPCCYSDFNKDGNRNIDDIFIYLNAWFGTASNPFAKIGGNGVDNANIDDLFVFINVWFAGGCG
jgi:hypothetical protein